MGLSASEMARIGNFTPVQEWTQVTASTRVFGVTARVTLSTISATDLAAASR